SLAKIIILTVPDYEWFRKKGTCNTTNVSFPFFSIEDVKDCQRACIVGILGNIVFRHAEAAKFLKYFQKWDLIVERLTQYNDKTRLNKSISVTSANEPEVEPGALETREPSATINLLLSRRAH